MHALAVDVAPLVEPRPVVKTYRVDNERVPFPTANRLSHPSAIRILWKFPPIHPNVTGSSLTLELH
jgi:hypothetical protein